LPKTKYVVLLHTGQNKLKR
jgi:hypothetical protein